MAKRSISRRRGPPGGAASSVSTPCTKSNTLGSAIRLARFAALTAHSIHLRSLAGTPRLLTYVRETGERAAVSARALRRALAVGARGERVAWAVCAGQV